MALTWLVASLASLAWEGLFLDVWPNVDELALQERVEFLLAEPVPAARASLDEVQGVPGVSPAQARALLAGRSDRGVAGALERIGSPLLVAGEPAKGWKGGVLLRARTDSLGGGARRVASFARVRFEREPWQAAGIVEKDRGEPSLFDFAGGGVRYCSGRVNAVLGNYDFGAGQGLVFSSSWGRSASRLAEDAGSAASLRLVNHADESAPLLGAGAELDLGRWRVSGLWSAAGRDARLNPDGTVERLVAGGVHDDSASLAQRNQVRQQFGGGAVRLRTGTVAAGIHAGVVRFSREFAPKDSAGSFVGRSLAGAGIAGSAWFGSWLAEAEAAACPTGLAAAAGLVGDWERIGARLAVRWREQGYFAPYGRWTSLTGTRDRLDASGALTWRWSGFRAGLSGNTYRDFALDSLPARVEVKAGQRLGPVDCELRLGRAYKLAEERYRTARLKLGAESGRPPGVRGGVRLMLADEHPETRPGRGRMVAAAGTMQAGRFRLDAVLARFDIIGTGVRMYLTEPGAMRIGASYGTARSAWRAAAGLALWPHRAIRLGLKAGWEDAGQPVWDAAAQAELALGQ